MTHVYLICIRSSGTGLTDKYSCLPRSPWVRCCRSLESFWASSCWCYSPSPLDSPSFMGRTTKTQTSINQRTAREYSASDRAMMHSTRMDQLQSVILFCDDNKDECAECLLRDVRDYINTADKGISFFSDSGFNCKIQCHYNIFFAVLL